MIFLKQYVVQERDLHMQFYAYMILDNRLNRHPNLDSDKHKPEPEHCLEAGLSEAALSLGDFLVCVNLLSKRGHLTERKEPIHALHASNLQVL
jgi:hypothetical protein